MAGTTAAAALDDATTRFVKGEGVVHLIAQAQWCLYVLGPNFRRLRVMKHEFGRRLGAVRRRFRIDTENLV
jgi:hypothetical protein